MGIFQPRDGRGYFTLPQRLEGAGYYVYGNVDHVPGTGHFGQFAHPAMLSLISWVERRWAAASNNAHPAVTKILFNDRKVPGVFPLARHEDHFHVGVRASSPSC